MSNYSRSRTIMRNITRGYFKKLSNIYIYSLLIASIALLSCSTSNSSLDNKQPVDYVNPYMGNISHLLVPTFPTIHMPHSMLRVYPEREDFTGDVLKGLPIVVTSHRGSSAFNLSPLYTEREELTPVIKYSYDNEKITPYKYHVYLDEEDITVDYTLSHQSAIYKINFGNEDKNGNSTIIINSRNGELKWDGSAISGYQNLAIIQRCTFIWYRNYYLYLL